MPLLVEENQTPETPPRLACPVCGASEGKLLFGGTRPATLTPFLVTTNDFGNFANLIKCAMCGFVREVMQVDDLEQAYIDSADLEYMKEEAGRTKTAIRILERIEKFIMPPARLLDVGCYTGIILAAARARGWETRGIELATWAVEVARNHYQLDVFHGTLADAEIPNDSLDVVTLVDVIEHLPEPVDMLKEIHSKVKANGMIYVSTPNVDSTLARVLGRRWWSYRLEHVSLFGVDSLKRALHESGFEVVEQQTRGRDFTFGYWASKWLASNPMGRSLRPLIHGIGMDKRLVYVNFFDQVDMLARKR